MSNPVQFRIIVGSYEHNVLCLSITLPSETEDSSKKLSQPFFQPIFHFEAHSLSIRAMDIAKRYLVSGSNDEHIRIYDLQKRKELGMLLQHQGSITKLVFSDEAPTKDSTKDNEKEGMQDKDKYVSHKNGKWLLSAAEDGKIVIWRTKDWEQFGVLKGHKARVNDLAIHPSGRVAISVSDDKTIKLWNLMTAKKASTLKLKGVNTHGQAAYLCKFNLDGDSFVVGCLTRMLIYNTREAKVNKLFKFKQTLMAMEFCSLNGTQYLIAAFGNGMISLFDYSKLLEIESNEDVEAFELPEPDFKLQGHASRVKGFSIYQEKTETGKILNFLVSISSDGKIVVWDLNKRDQVAVYDTGERLNVVGTVNESIEKAGTMKPRYDPTKEVAEFTESEHESDGESLGHILKGRKKKSKKQMRKDKQKLLSVEM